MVISVGDKGEGLVKELLEHFDVKVEEKGDILNCKIGRKKFVAEVRFDKLVEKYGNLTIPKRQTVSNVWLQIIPDGNHFTVWIASTDALRKYIGVNERKEIQSEGETLMLYKSDRIMSKTFHRLDTLPKKQAKKLIRGLL